MLSLSLPPDRARARRHFRLSEIAMDALNSQLASKSYLGGDGYVFSDADEKTFRSLASVPSRQTHPHAFRWYKTVAAQLNVSSASVAAQAAQAPAFPVPVPPADAVGFPKPSYAASAQPGPDRGVPSGCMPEQVAVAPAAANEDMGGDDLFADDDMGGDDLFGDDDAAPAPAMSLAEKAKAAQ